MSISKSGSISNPEESGSISNPEEEGPFYHGTKADLQEGDLLTAGFHSNYRPEVVMNHIYFTALVDEVRDWRRRLLVAPANRACIGLSPPAPMKTTQMSPTRSFPEIQRVRTAAANLCGSSPKPTTGHGLLRKHFRSGGTDWTAFSVTNVLRLSIS